jgi:hypothetical protein
MATKPRMEAQSPIPGRFEAFPVAVFERFDPIPKAPPTLTRRGARRDPRTNGRGCKHRKQRVVRRQQILIRINPPALHDSKNPTCCASEFAILDSLGKTSSLG